MLEVVFEIFGGRTKQLRFIAGSFHNSPQLRTIIQEVVDRSSWQRFNSIAIIIRRSSGSTGRRIAESIEGSGSKLLPDQSVHASHGSRLICCFYPTFEVDNLNMRESRIFRDYSL